MNFVGQRRRSLGKTPHTSRLVHGNTTSLYIKKSLLNSSVIKWGFSFVSNRVGRLTPRYRIQSCLAVKNNVLIFFTNVRANSKSRILTSTSGCLWNIPYFKVKEWRVQKNFLVSDPWQYYVSSSLIRSNNFCVLEEKFVYQYQIKSFDLRQVIRFSLAQNQETSSRKEMAVLKKCSPLSSDKSFTERIENESHSVRTLPNNSELFWSRSWDTISSLLNFLPF